MNKYKENKNYYILCIVNLFQGMVFYGPISTIYRENHGLKLSEILFLESILMAVILVFEIPFGIIGDRFGYKKTLLISVGGLFLSKIIFCYAYGFKLFLIQTIITGISMAGVSGCDSAIIYESIDEEISEKAFATFQSFGILGFFIGAIGCSILVNISVNITATLTSVAYGISFLGILFIKDIKKNTSKIRKKSFIEDIKKIKIKRGFIVFIVAVFSVYEVGHAIEVYLSQLKYVSAGIGYEYFGVIAVLAQLLSLSSAKTYWITRKLGQVQSVLLIILTMILAVLGLIFTNNKLETVIFSVVIQVGMAMLIPIIVDMENKSIDKSSINRATILSIYSMIGSVVGIIINFLIGIESKTALISSFRFCLTILFIGFLVVIFYCIKEVLKDKKL